MRSIISTRRAAVTLAALSLATGITAASAAGSDSPNGHATAKGAAPLAQPVIPPGTDLQFHVVAPCRLVDTRLAGGALNHSTRNFTAVGSLSGQGGSSAGCGVPSSAVAIQANITAVAQGQTGYLTAFAAGSPLPNASTVNYGTSGAIANAVTVPLNGADQFAIFSYKKAYAITDVLGYYTQPLYAAVTSIGTVYDGISSGVVATAHPSTGVYTVTFNRAVRYCSVTASDIIFASTRDVSVDQTYSPSNDVATIHVTDTNNNPADTYFNITAAC